LQIFRDRPFKGGCEGGCSQPSKCLLLNFGESPIKNGNAGEACRIPIVARAGKAGEPLPSVFCPRGEDQAPGLAELRRRPFINNGFALVYFWAARLARFRGGLALLFRGLFAAGGRECGEPCRRRRRDGRRKVQQKEVGLILLKFHRAGKGGGAAAASCNHLVEA